MRLLAGTSGFSYKQWKGPFYPEDLPDRGMLAFYGQRLSTVEVNNTFYRMPKAENLQRWAEAVPDGFTFVLKAPQSITHRARLENAEDSVAYLWEASAALGEHRGPFLFQLPPYFKQDLPRLQAFLAGLPAGMRAAFEFRHASWIDDEVHAALREAGAALCTADVEDGGEAAPLVGTADWGYLRLRRPAYTEDELSAWSERLREQPWSEAFVFFKHEDAGVAPRLAAELAARFAGD